MSASVLATVAASTKRRPAASGNKITAPVEHLASILITPFQAITAELALQSNIRDAHEVKVCHTFKVSGSLPDIKEGDILVVSAVEYIMQSVAEFNRDVISDDSYLRLIVHQRKITA